MIRTKRWSDPVERDDGFRLLICRFRPRGVRKADETWSAWERELGPSAELLAAFQGKRAAPISWGEYRRRYLREMAAQADRIRELATRVADGGTITLLCATSCVDAERCHRSLLKTLVERALSAGRATRAAARGTRVRPRSR